MSPPISFLDKYVDGSEKTIGILGGKMVATKGETENGQDNENVFFVVFVFFCF